MRVYGALLKLLPELRIKTRMAVVFNVVSVDSATFPVHPSHIPVALFRLAARPPPMRADPELRVSELTGTLVLLE